MVGDKNAQKYCLCEVSIIFEKESFINAEKVLNFIQSLVNENKVVKSLTAFHIPTHSLIISSQLPHLIVAR